MNEKWQNNHYQTAKSIVKNKDNITINEKTALYVEKQLVAMAEAVVSLYEEKYPKGHEVYDLLKDELRDDK